VLDIFNNEPIQTEEIKAPEVVVEYKVVILNDSGDILFSESELDDEAVDSLAAVFEKLRGDLDQKRAEELQPKTHSLSAKNYSEERSLILPLSGAQDVVAVPDFVSLQRPIASSAWLVADETLFLKLISVNTSENDALTASVSEVPIDTASFGNPLVTSVNFDNEGTLWVLLQEDNGWRLTRRSPASDEWLVAMSGRTTKTDLTPTDFIIGESGAIYITSSYPPAIYRFDAGSGKMDLVSAVNDRATSVVEAPQGLVVSGPSKSSTAFDEEYMQVLTINRIEIGESIEDPRSSGQFSKYFKEWSSDYPTCGPNAKSVIQEPISLSWGGQHGLVIANASSNTVVLQPTGRQGQILWGNSDCSSGSSINSLDKPIGVSIDEQQNIAIIDGGNDRLIILHHGDTDED
tara:strand:- start:49 stop:1260 length:1212 start_codon:yes stop_codon:yes gene_type:complete